MRGLLMGMYRPECRGGNTPLTILLLWSWPRWLSSTCCTLKGTNWDSQYFELRLQFAWLWLWKCVLQRQCISRLVFHKLPDAFDVKLLINFNTSTKWDTCWSGLANLELRSRSLLLVLQLLWYFTATIESQYFCVNLSESLLTCRVLTLKSHILHHSI